MTTWREPTICACASASGGTAALVRLSGPRAFAIAASAGIETRCWRLGPESGPGYGSATAVATCPVRTLFRRGPHTATGHDLVEILVPGAADLVALGLAALHAAGAEPAAPGAFTRQAVATGRLSLDRAEAVLALAQASDAQAAAAALARLQGALAADLQPLKADLLRVRALVESGLDFLDEHDVRPWNPDHVIANLTTIVTHLDGWLIAAGSLENIPLICLVGAPNAGKSALFAELTGEPALISPIAGTTRDHLDARCDLLGRAVRLVDTAGWLSTAFPRVDHGDLELQAVDAGKEVAASADLVVACAAPDAPLPEHLDIAQTLGIPANKVVIIATKSDLAAPADPRAVLAISVAEGHGLAALRGLLSQRLAPQATGSARQQGLLRAAITHLHAAIAQARRSDDQDALMADDLRRASQLLDEVVGTTTDDDVLNAIFAAFCIGK